MCGGRAVWRPHFNRGCAANETADSGASAGEEAAAGAAEGTGFDFVVGVGAVVGLAALAFIPVALNALQHNTSHTLLVYNLTPYTLTWSALDTEHGAMNMAPQNATASGENYLIPAMNPGYSPDPDIAPVAVASNAMFTFANTSGYAGIQYAMGFAFTDPTTNAAIDSVSVAFDIPFDGANSISAMSGTPADASTWVDSVAGNNAELTYNFQSSVVTLQASYNALTGETTDPVTGQNGYYYSSILVFSMPSSSSAA